MMSGERDQVRSRQETQNETVAWIAAGLVARFNKTARMEIGVV